MSSQLSGKRILSFVGDIYEDLELWYPKLRMIEAGAEFVCAGPDSNTTYSGKNGYPCLSDASIAEMVAAERGIGFMVLNASEFLVTDVVIAGIIVIGIIAYCFDLLMRYLEVKLIPWKGYN